MQFDDRLATVLRHRAAGEAAARTQFRQLLDLLGSRRLGRDPSLLATAWLRLGALGETIPATERARMIREPGLRFRNPELAAHLAEDEPEVAAAALAVARLAEEDWVALIPRLPVRARGFLRMRRDLPKGAVAVLEQLGIHDRGLPQPDTAASQQAETAPPQPKASEPARPAAVAERPRRQETGEIGQLVQRIESFRQTRKQGRGEQAPRLPLGETAEGEAGTQLAGFSFTTDARGRIDWADPAVAPSLVGARLHAASERIAALFHRKQVVRGIPVRLEGAPLIAGDWIVDAAPRFAANGHCYGYVGKSYRAAPAAPEEAARAREGDRLRQVLHELRTPANAIQGFAEVIQQQLFGPVPHEYRAHAAAIAADAARILAGFEELDRLVKLDAGDLALGEGTTDLAGVARHTAERLAGVLQARGAAVEVEAETGPIPVRLDRDEAGALAWRILGTLAGGLDAHEKLHAEVSATGGQGVMRCSLPAMLASKDDPFEVVAPGAATGPLSTGMFGAGFALRLARAEARSIGGELRREGEALELRLPLLTADEGEPSDGGKEAGATGSA